MVLFLLNWDNSHLQEIKGGSREGPSYPERGDTVNSCPTAIPCGHLENCTPIIPGNQSIIHMESLLVIEIRLAERVTIFGVVT